MFIDLHIHSTSSDGTDSPEKILEKISLKEGIKIFSLTDHDTISGVKKIKNIIPDNVIFINGVEFSCKTDSGKKCHILAYFYDSESEDFQRSLAQGKNLHNEKFLKRVEFLGKLYGINFTDDDIAEICKNEVVGKPHIVNFIAEKYGIAKEKIYKDLRKCYVESSRISARKVIDAVKKSGGITVWAHPLGGEGEKILSHEEFESRLDELMSYGINGLECYYSRYTNTQEKFLAETAQKNNLLISCGSDYHGTNKNISFGELGADLPEVKIPQITLLKKIFECNEDLRVRKAFEFASMAHSNQFDKAGTEYIFHPMTVALSCNGDISAMIVALLHDVAEDTNFSLEYSQEKIFLTSKEFDALKLLTHEDNISYFDYIERIKASELATKVKIADLKHNSDLSRIPKEVRTEKDFARIEKYAQALKILQEDF